MTPVVKPFFPPLKEYQALLNKVWESEMLTNRGPMVLDLEAKLKAFLNLEGNIIATNNGTLPLQIILNSFKGPESEIITTPFSYVATTSSIVWEGYRPRFADILEDELTINPEKVKELINPKTKGILATHVFGNPCRIEELIDIGKSANIPVIFDAAHSFGVKYLGKSIFDFGDVSTCSFHATKLFHTGEGGAIFTKSENLNDQFFQMHNFGHVGKYDFDFVGINAKMSELQAALGLCNLKYFPTIIYERKKIVNLYKQSINWTKYRGLKLRENTDWNYSYFPIIFDSEETLQKALNKLNQQEIYPRRYFYPSLNTIYSKYLESAPKSEMIAKTILCLPLFVGLKEDIILKITSILNEF